MKNKSAPLIDEEKLALLEEWISQFYKIEKVYDDLKKMFNIDPESIFVNTLYDTFDKYTKMLSFKVSDNDDWLNWYIWENGCGKKKMKAKASNWKKDRPICNIKDLAAIIDGSL